MAKTIPFNRNQNVARARRAKTKLLPIPRETRDELALQVHVGLDAMRRGRGNVRVTQTLTQVMILTGLLAEAGYGSLAFEQMRRAERAVSSAFDRGRESGIWSFDEDEFAQFATIVTIYDEQLRRAPLSALSDASGRLDRFRAGESFEQVTRGLSA